MKGVSEFITSTSRKKTDNISGINLFNNNNNNKNPTSIFNERKKEKKYILKDDFLQSHNSSNKKSDIVEVKDSLNSNNFEMIGKDLGELEKSALDKYLK